MNSKRSFLDTIYILFIFGKFFGLSCYGITRGRSKYKVSFHMSHFIQFLGVIGSFLLLIYFNFQFELNSDENSTLIFNQAQQIQMILSLVFAVAGYSQVLLMRQTFWDLAHTIQDIDHRITQLLKMEVDHGHLYRFTLIRLVACYSSLVVVFTIFGYYCFVVNRSEGMIVQYFTYVIITVTFTLLSIQFQAFMHAMCMRFSILNTFVESRILTQTQLEMPSSTLVELQSNIFSTAKISDQLNNLIPPMSQYFSTFTIPATLGVFCATVFNLHNLFRALTQENSFQFYLLFSIYQMVGILLNALSGFNIAIASNSTYEAKQMGALVHKVIAHTRNQPFILKLKMLSMQVLHRSPNVSFGLFSLNWQWAFSYVASVASYLFILIQFVMYIDEKSAVMMQNQQTDFLMNYTLT